MWFLNYSKNYISKFMQAHSWYNKYSPSIYPFEFAKHGKEGKKLQKLEYLENNKTFFDKTKNSFYSFWWDIVWWKKHFVAIASIFF